MQFIQNINPQRFCQVVLVLFVYCSTCGVAATTQLDNLVNDYISHWQDFYPSEALSNGRKSAAFDFEDFSPERLSQWRETNRQTLKQFESYAEDLELNAGIDARVLKRQVLLEMERWEKDRVLDNSAIFYAELVSQALTYVLVRDQLTPEEKIRATRNRLQGIQRLCGLAVERLKDGSPQRTRRALNILQRTITFYQQQLPAIVRDWSTQGATGGLNEEIIKSIESVRNLVRHIEVSVVPVMSIADRYTPADYARKLAIHLDDKVSPSEMAALALAEVDTVRGLMASEARAWWMQEYGERPVPDNEQTLLQNAMQAMEDDRTDNREDFLRFFTRLTDEAETFVSEKKLATVPLPRTLFIGLSPDHFSGAAYGGVYPTGPFNPDADTLFYLPTIPDDSPAEQKTGFYRSFNNHFNTMIIAHEMLPGHYMQYKIAVEKAPALRSLFANGVYVEGWGSFSEELMLDAGWGDNNSLTRLAHLRKRLENATRAYVSVKVHVDGWEQQQLMDFATTRGLLAPQFAINLWNRVMNSPFQIPTYFLGFHQFQELWHSEQQRLEAAFSTRDFVDAVLRAGPVPIDTLASLLQ